MSNLPPVYRYRILREIGRGGLGVVFHALDLVMGREVALKTLRPDRNLTRSACERFLQEVRLTSQLSHYGTVPIYSVHQDDEGRPWYAMRLVDGQDLREWLVAFHTRRRQSGRQLDLLALHRQVRRMVVVCSAVGHAHARGILHRDIKPTNLMVGRNGDTYILDWGMAGRDWSIPHHPDGQDPPEHEFQPDWEDDPHRPASSLVDPVRLDELLDGVAQLAGMMVTRIVIEPPPEPLAPTTPPSRAEHRPARQRSPRDAAAPSGFDLGADGTTNAGPSTGDTAGPPTRAWSSDASLPSDEGPNHQTSNDQNQDDQNTNDHTANDDVAPASSAHQTPDGTTAVLARQPPPSDSSLPQPAPSPPTHPGNVSVDQGNPTVSHSLSGSEDGPSMRLYGTLGYAAPEQLRPDRHPIGPASDVYALGATLYEMITGLEPHRSDCPKVAYQTIVARRIRSPHAVNSAIPRRLSAICERAMAVRPEDRYQTAAALAADLSRYLDDLPIRAYPDRWHDPVTRFLRRDRKALMVGSAALVALTVVTTGAAIISNHQREIADELAERGERLRRATVNRRVEAEREREQAEDAQRRSDAARELILSSLALVRDQAPEQASGVHGTFAHTAQRVRRGERSPELQATVFDVLADCYLAIGDAERASALATEAVIRQRAARGPDDPFTIAYQIMEARALEAAGRLDDADARWSDLAQRAAAERRVGFRGVEPILRAAMIAERNGDWPRVIAWLEPVNQTWGASYPLARPIGLARSLLGRAYAEISPSHPQAETLLADGARVIDIGDGFLPSGIDHAAAAKARLARLDQLRQDAPPTPAISARQAEF